MRILIAESNLEIAKSLEASLLASDFNVYATDDGEEAVDLGKMYDYDIIVLGDFLSPPNQDVLRRLRGAKVKTPVLVLSVLAEPAVKMLNAGADDYVVRPVEPLELVARINAIVRRSRGHAASLVQVGPLVVNLDTKTVSVSEQPVHLTGKEYAMLELMALRKGTLITKDMFLNHLYGGMDEPEVKIIDVFICKLRKKLDLAGGWGHLVATVWGRGYVLGEVGSEGEAVGEFAGEPPVHVTGMTALEVQTAVEKRKFGVPVVVSPSLVPSQEGGK